MKSCELNPPLKRWLMLLFAMLVAPMSRAQPPPALSQAKAAPVEIVLVQAETVTPAAVAEWKKEGFKAVAVVLDERISEATGRAIARHSSEGGLDV